jgi:SAM-dependent methyltransferase
MNRIELVNPYEGDANLAARLFMHMHAFLYEQTGQLLPAEIDLAEVWNVLDAGCGLGGWVLDMARVHQDMDIVGVDIDPQVLVLGRMDGRAWMLENVNFVEGDIRDMHDIEDNAFDIVHARFINPIVPARSWHVILREFWRVCRPGGKIVWTETVDFKCSSEACLRWCNLLQRAITQTDASPQNPRVMDMLLSDASWRHVRLVKLDLDLSTGGRAHTRIYRNLTYLLSMTQLYLTEMGLISPDEVERIHQKLILDLYSDAFTASWSIVTAIGEKASQVR